MVDRVLYLGRALRPVSVLVIFSVVVAAWVVVGPTATASAAPVIDVRARTRIGIDRVVRTGQGVHIHGTLIDAMTGEGISGRHIEVDVDGGGWQIKAASGQSGQFRAYVEIPAGEHDIAARFVGDEAYGDSATVPRAYDVDKAAAALEIRVEGPVDATASEVVAHVTVGSIDAPEQMALVISAGDAGNVGGIERVSTIHTDARGEATASIPRARFGRPGEKIVVVRFEGSDAVNPAEAQTTFTLATTTQLVDVNAPPVRLAFEADVSFAGRLVEADGTGVIAGVVVLRNGSARVREIVTDDVGAFALTVPARDLGAGPTQLTLAHDSTVSWRRGTRVGPFAVEIAAPQPVPVSYSLLTFGVTAAAVLAYVLLRARPWLAVTATIRRRRRKPEAAAVATPSPDDAAPAPGLRVARPGIMSSLRRATDHGFTGRVCDVVRGYSVGGALLVLSSSQERRELVADADGHFETQLPDGWWQVEVSAHGYVTETVRAPIPHRGELRGARIDLLPVREKVFAIYRQVAAPLLPKPELWGVWTPREIFDHARAARPDGAFGQLTALVEETYFSMRVPDEAVVASAQASAAAAAGELQHQL